jgi:hypothetical protein
VRRWDKDKAIGDNWDHQSAPVSIVDVQPGSVDYNMVLNAFYGRKRGDNRALRITPQSHSVARVRRIQNRKQCGLFQAYRKSMEDQRGKAAVDQTEMYAWHGSGKTNPCKIANGDGFMMQYGGQGFYQQGFYFAHQASYSHHERYVYRSSDIDGQHPCAYGKYHHLLLVKVLRGKPYKTCNVWNHQGHTFGYAQRMLGGNFDSVEGGPHRPLCAGRGEDDSLVYVVYHPSQCLPEFIVTYEETMSA